MPAQHAEACTTERTMKDTTLKSAQSPSRDWRYVSKPGHWDELSLPSGHPRKHWRKLAVALAKMGFRNFSRRWHAGQQLIEANGVTYNVYGDPEGKERSWRMDPIPLVVRADEWEHIERAVIQRAVLFNAMLGDLYNARKLVKDRHLPAALLFGNPNFLRPCSGIVPPHGVYLHTFAVDLARSPAGDWWVIADRTQAPSGIGYALENRLVGASTLPNIFNRCQVRPLTRFFEVSRDALMALAPSRQSSPRVVLLTPGPHNETYFEHSFLARNFGFPLVEGGDLTVRDNRVYLKTLAGLEPVDLVMRRMDDGFCDPLELRGESLLGVPGLVQAVRSGNVAVANALGSGLTETASHMAFLPGLCQHLLSEKLLMPSVATWWCGQEEPRGYVLEHLDDLVIKPAFPSFQQHAEFPAAMTTPNRLELIRRIEADPDNYVAQERVPLSTAPVWTPHGIVSRHVVLRVFAAWDGSSYTVMPGGLTRVSTEDSPLVVSMQLGGGSKDTWVLRSGNEAAAPANVPPLVIDQARSPGELPSRMADNLFWLGRYAERVESGARLVRALLPGLSGEQDFGSLASLDTIVHLMAGLDLVPPELVSMPLAEQRWQLSRRLSEMVFDPARTSGIGWNLKQIRRVTWPLKERLSQDTWRVLQQLETEFSATAPAQVDQRFVAAIGLLDRAILTLSAFAGLLMENTTRGYGWHFLDIGRRLERALQTGELLRAGIAEAPFEVDPYLTTLLQIADSSITYRTRYLTTLRVEFALELLLADEANPRSAAFQLATLRDHVRNMPNPRDQEQWTDGSELNEYGIVDRVLGAVREARMDDLATRDSDGNLGALEALLRQMKARLYDFSDTLTARYLSHLRPSRLTSSM
jgi:uncharacterized circularly permuted ATP-grasp superfamily protein/uncharacterized alpha-E superfamily protein